VSRKSKRKVMGERKPSGRLRPRREVDPRFPTMWRRIKEHGIKLGVHPYVGTAIGRLSLIGALTDHQAEAGFRFAEIVGRYHAYCTGAPRYNAMSPAYERGAMKPGPHAIESEGSLEKTAHIAEKSQRAYQRMMRAVPNTAAEALLISVCVENHDPPSLKVSELTQLLGALAAALGIGGGSRRAG